MALYGLTHALLPSLVVAQSASSQQPPALGDLLNRPSMSAPGKPVDRNAEMLQLAKPNGDLPSAPPLQGAGQIQVNRFVFDSDVPTSLISPAALQAELQSVNNRVVTLRELQAAVGKLDATLKARYGLIQSKAWLPVQDVKDGVVSIKILKGTIAAVRVGSEVPPGHVSDALLKIANTYLIPGEALQQINLEAAAYRATDYFGGTVRIVLVPSTRLGDYDVLLEPVPRSKISGYVGLDNTGSSYTAQWHDTMGVHIRNVSGLGDSIALSGQLLTENQRSAQIRYQIPTTQGWIFGGARQYADYSLCCNFASLNMRGSSTTTSVDAAKSLVRGRDLSVRVGGILQRRELRSLMNTDTVFNRHVESAALQADIDWSNVADHSIQASLTSGKADLSRNLNDFSQDATTAQIHGHFSKLLISYTQLRPLPQGLRMKLTLTGQFADKNLDSSEKLSLGGLSGVRAYPYGEAMADQALLGQIELSKQVSSQWQFGVFFDWGRAQRNQKAWSSMSSPNTYNLQGVGLSSIWQPIPQLNIQMIVAAKLGSNQGATSVGGDSDGRDSLCRPWIQAVWSF
jgi:hemolysin activation/secretion protein